MKKHGLHLSHALPEQFCSREDCREDSVSIGPRQQFGTGYPQAESESLVAPIRLRE
jgi:hypothetical protein